MWQLERTEYDMILYEGKYGLLNSPDNPPPGKPPLWALDSSPYEPEPGKGDWEHSALEGLLANYTRIDNGEELPDAGRARLPALHEMIESLYHMSLRAQE